MTSKTASYPNIKLSHINTNWKHFPSTAPKDGRSIIVGGFTEDGEQWVEVIVHFGPFCGSWNEICRETRDSDCKWILHGFTTLETLHEINWHLWHEMPLGPTVSTIT